MMETTTRLTSSRYLGLQTLWGAWQRLSMILLMMMFTTVTAWAKYTVDDVVITLNQDSWMYTGNEICPAVTGVSIDIDGEPVNLFSYGMTVTYSFNTYVSSENSIPKVHVTLPDWEEVPAELRNVGVSKTFTITKAPLTVTAGSASKVYDGTPLTCNDYTVEGLVGVDAGYGVSHSATVTGSQTDVGESANVPSNFIIGSTGIESNYDITYVNGTLTVTANPDDWEETATEYTIKTATGWDVFCDLLEANNQGYFTDKTVKLGANISVTRMAGSSGHDFTGTFDGDGHTLTVSYGSSDSPITEDYAAPFRYVDGGTIENLCVSGTIYTSAQYAGGFIGIAEGSASIVNSASGVTINSSTEGEGAHGGFVGQQANNDGITLYMEGCVFNGKQLGASTTSCGGFVGWGKKTVYIRNSLYAPAAATGSEAWIDTNTEGCATFSRNSESSFTNSYYTEALGTKQGDQARTISAGEGVTVAHAGVATTYGVSGITAYKASDADDDPFIAGLVYNNVLYAGKYDVVSLTLANTPPTGYSFGGYTTYTDSPDGATLTRDGDNYTLFMPDADVTIGATFMELVSVSYIDADGKEQTIDAIPLQGGGATTLAPGWYVVNNDVTYTGTVTLGGDVNIILADGKTMTVNTSDTDGFYGTSYTLTIYGQTLGTGILNANRPIYCAFTMTGGTVNATSNPYAIRGTTTVSGGTLNATGQYAINGNVTVSGGNVTVTSTDIAARLTRSDWDTLIKTIAIFGNLSLSGPATVTINGYVKVGVTIADGLTFTDGDGNNDYSGTLSFEKMTAIKGKTLRLAALQLADAADNTAVVAKCNGVTGIDITLQGRTLYKDGDWNTLCLPFNVTLSGSPLAGAEARPLSEASITGTTLTLNFGDAVSTLAAGMPYIIKWTKDDVNPTIDNPVFSGVTIDATDNSFDNSVNSDLRVRFLGTYKSTTFDGVDKSILFLGADNTLYYPQPDIDTENPENSKFPTIGAQRAYFKIGEDGANNARQITAFNLDFGDSSESTGIREIDTDPAPSPAPTGVGRSEWYTMEGVKLSGKPTKSGVYIHNGKKVVIP